MKKMNSIKNSLRVVCILTIMTFFVIVIMTGGCSITDGKITQSTPPTISPDPSPTSTISPAPTPTFSPIPSPSPTIDIKWSKIDAPMIVNKMQVNDNTIFILNTVEFYKSNDGGDSWEIINLNINPQYDTGDFNCFDIDQNRIWVGCRNGIIVSENLDGNFQWSMYWDWDPCYYIDMNNGNGWATISSWGSKSGALNKTPDSEWISYGRDELFYFEYHLPIVADLKDVNTAYINNYKTTDNCKTWSDITEKVIYCTIRTNDKLAIYSKDKFSIDRGITWKPLNITATAITNVKDTLFIGTEQGVYSGQPDDWTALGLADENIIAIAINDNYIFALNDKGKLFRKTK